MFKYRYSGRGTGWEQRKLVWFEATCRLLDRRGVIGFYYCSTAINGFGLFERLAYTNVLYV